MGRESSSSSGGAKKAGALVAGGIGWLLTTAWGAIGAVLAFAASLASSLAGRACGGQTASKERSHIGELPGHGGTAGRSAVRRKRIKLVLLVLAITAAGYAFTRWDARELSSMGFSDGFEDDGHHVEEASEEKPSPGGLVARMTSRIKGLWPFGDAASGGGGGGGDGDADGDGDGTAGKKKKKKKAFRSDAKKMAKRHKGLDADVYLNPQSLEALAHDAGGAAPAGFGALAAQGADPNVARYKARIKELEALVTKLRGKLDKAVTCCEAAT